MQPSSSPVDGGGGAAPSSSQLAAPCATAEGDASTSLLDVVALVLQYSDLLDGTARDFCSLLQTSKGAASAAVQQCRGLRMVLEARTPEAAERLVPWIARHGQAVADLELAYAGFRCDPPAAAAAAALAGALRQAAFSQKAAATAAAGAAPAGMQLRSLQLSVRPATAADLLEVAGGQLTSLTLLPQLGDDSDKAGVARTAAALSGLPGLQRLELGNGTADILPALSGITSLTRLAVWDCRSASLLRHLPSQLQALVLSGHAPSERDSLQVSLQHCTALRQLDIDWAPDELLEGERLLPVTLEVLGMDGPAYQTAAPLLALTRLTRLELWEQLPPAAELRQLSQLTRLSSIKLNYNDEDVSASSEAWSQLRRLQELRFWVDADEPSCNATLRHLGAATSLTWLELCFMFKRPADAGGTIEALAAALASLSRLEVLVLDMGADFFTAIPGMAALAASVAGLTRLHTLESTYMRWGDAASQLATATQLTSLTIQGLSVEFMSESSLTAIVCGLTQLRSLQLRHGAYVTDACLAVVARHLRHLTHLKLDCCNIMSLQGISQLAQLPRLWKLEIGSRQFSAADVRAALAAAGGGGPWLQLSVS